MSKEIKEMAEVLSTHFQSELDLSNDIYEMATSLYEVGYRKQSDTVKEFAENIIADLEKAIEINIKGSTEALQNKELETYNFCLGQRWANHCVTRFIEGLKKEYGVE